ncbi:hypothetical protein NQ314_011593 [Rhamnusium bicolor]|uniref:Uncharacterized protein n=1 Tax=Rhamnusium bicolor TaxID=1586634 RepID=A0AAV8XGN3_9CUCU|nr:hypothetical protein NQ314_011593 [Rhamnusium bicolor]
MSDSTNVTNFSRHLFRKHANEESVANILRISKGDAKRKPFIDLLRRQGNFSIYSENIIRPVQRPSSLTVSENVQLLTFLPCRFCKGLYKKSLLIDMLENVNLITKIQHLTRDMQVKGKPC